MAKEKLLVIKEADITNNCPECFNQNMKITFYQKHTYGRLFHRTTSEISHQIKCNTCESLIYPVNWTTDIERIFGYYQKMVQPMPPSTRFTLFFYIFMLFMVVMTGALVYMLLKGVI